MGGRKKKNGSTVVGAATGRLGELRPHSLALLALAAGTTPLLGALAPARGDIFVGSFGAIGEYTTSGATVNASLVSGLSYPEGIAGTEAPLPSTVALLAIGSLAPLAPARSRAEGHRTAAKIIVRHQVFQPDRAGLVLQYKCRINKESKS